MWGTNKENSLMVAVIECITNGALREESSQTNVTLQYKLLAAIWSALCSVIQQS